MPIATGTRCNDLHEIILENGERQEYLCRRQYQHPGYHQCGSITFWGRLWGSRRFPPSPGRAEPRRPER